MIKHFLLILFISTIAVSTQAGNNSSANSDHATGSAVRNSVYYNYNSVNGKSTIEEELNFSDDFNLPYLREIWTHTSDANWSLKERPGYLRLEAQQHLDFSKQPSFAQKVDFNTSGIAACFIDLSAMKEGNATGLYFTNKTTNRIQICVENGKKYVEVVIDHKKTRGPEIENSEVMMRAKIASTKVQFEYSTDGQSFQSIGNPFLLNAAVNNTDKVGIFCIDHKANGGSTDVDWFYYQQEKDQKTSYAELQ